jgi:CRISPR-associated protein Csb1
MPESTAVLTLDVVRNAVAGSAAAFRCKLMLSPAGGPGDKVFPPTYAGAVYATEKRRLPDYNDPVTCVLLDSVQSQANRMEEALQQAVDAERINLPIIEVDFEPFFPGKEQPEEMRLLDPVGRVTSLQVPHRIADAILRDSLLDGTRFRDSEIGTHVGMASIRNATVLFELCPTALLFGMWDSTGPKGGLGAKFERAMVSEIVGINAVPGVKTSSRIDPLAIQLKAGPLYAAASSEGVGWTLDESQARKQKEKSVMLGKDGRPSEANHGNVTPDIDYRRDQNRGLVKDKEGNPIAVGGVTIDRAEQTIVLSLPALRRLRFPIDGKLDRKVDIAAQTVLVALGLCAAALADDAGLDLRSRCLLYPEQDLKWNLLDRKANGEFALPAEDAIKLLNDAIAAAREAGLPWREEVLTLRPSDQLVKLVVKSQQLAIQQGGDAAEGGE